MRFYYADPGLLSQLGHHASSCRFITRELMRRNIETEVFAFAKVDQRVQAQLGARPHFRAFTYWITDNDPICGWLNAYYAVAETTRDDLALLTGLCNQDILYLNSGQAAQLLALAQWAALLPTHQVPHIVMEFGVDPGMDVHFNPDGMSFFTRDPRRDARAILLRHAACQIPKSLQSRFHLMTFEPNSSAAYRALLDKPVGVLPMPRYATTARRQRRGTRHITIAVLGHQRPDKGYHLMPEIAKGLLKARSNIHILVHNGDPKGMPDTQQAIRALAAVESRLVFDERLADDIIWTQLLQCADVILCPYDAQRFAISYSAVAADAIANAIPLVVPARSSLARLMTEFGNAGTTFEKVEPQSVIDATVRLLDQLEEIVPLAEEAAEKWAMIHGPDRFVDSILSLVGPRTANRERHVAM